MATYYDAINDGETILSNTLDIGEVTSFVVNDGSQLPVGGAGTSGFIIKLEDTLGNAEYIECSHRSGNTVYISNRGFEGTFARTWISGSYLKNVFTKATKDEITNKILVATDASITASINPKTIEDKSGTIILPRTKSEYVFYDNATSGLISTNIQDAIDELDVDIGNLLYTENNYILDNEPLTTSVNKLDMAVKEANDDIGNLLYTENNYILDNEPLTTSVNKLDMAVFDKASKGSGTFTPSLAGATTPGSHTYTTRNGFYYKIGDLVFARFVIQLSAKDAAMAGDVKVTGLPFSATADAGGSPVTIGRTSGITVVADQDNSLSGFVAPSGSIVNLVAIGNGTYYNVGSAVVTGTAYIEGSVVYKATS